jgi:hypothetical protein
VMEPHWERRSDGTPARVLRDHTTGRKWRVWVADTRRVPGAPGASCLLFDTGDCVRRVWQVPDDWGRMPPEALLRLAESPTSGPASGLAPLSVGRDGERPQPRYVPRLRRQ